MQVLKDEKQEKILAAAARMFATRPFHEVLLSEVAAEAGVGKGTIYTYFENKDELYRSVLYSGFSTVLDRLRERLKKDVDKPRQSLRIVVQEYVRFAFLNPHVFELMRTASVKASERAKWMQKRQELSDLIESIIRQGIELGQFDDPHPELTALFIPGLVRSALLFGSENINAQMLTAHVLYMVEAALEARNSK